VAVREDPATLPALHRLWSEDAPGWELVVTGKAEAEHLLTASSASQPPATSR